MKEHIEGVTVEEAEPYLTKDPELDEFSLLRILRSMSGPWVP